MYNRVLPWLLQLCTLLDPAISSVVAMVLYSCELDERPKEEQLYNKLNTALRDDKALANLAPWPEDVARFVRTCPALVTYRGVAFNDAHLDGHGLAPCFQFLVPQNGPVLLEVPVERCTWRHAAHLHGP